MADSKVTSLPAATVLTGGTFYGAQGGASKGFPAALFAGNDLANVFTAAQTITPASANVTPLTLNQLLTGANAQAALSITPTWNTSGAPTALLVDVTDTASNASSFLQRLRVGGVTQFSVTKAGRVDFSGVAFGYGFASYSNAGYFSLGSAQDVVLWRDAAGILSQRNGANAQTFRVANADDGAGNFERGVMSWNEAANVLHIGATSGGTGTIRSTMLRGGTLQFAVGAAGVVCWTVPSGGHFLAQSDNSFDIGASGANRPRNLYMASWIRMATTVVASLPAAATAGAGARMMVTDASAPVFGSAVVGGGAVTVPVYSTGAAWNVG